MTADTSSAASASVVTSASLLVRARARDEGAWRQLAHLYGPMVYRWARQVGLQASDAQDVVQNVFLAVAADLGRFRRAHPGDSFRGWLRTICRHKIVDHFRARPQREWAAGGTTAQHRLQQVAVLEPDADDASDDRCRLRHRALALLREHFEASTWEAFLRTVVHGDRPQDVARDLAISVATVYRARYRVLTRLRRELEEL